MRGVITVGDIIYKALTAIFGSFIAATVLLPAAIIFTAYLIYILEYLNCIWGELFEKTDLSLYFFSCNLDLRVMLCWRVWISFHPAENRFRRLSLLLCRSTSHCYDSDRVVCPFIAVNHHHNTALSKRAGEKTFLVRLK